MFYLHLCIVDPEYNVNSILWSIIVTIYTLIFQRTPIYFCLSNLIVFSGRHVRDFCLFSLTSFTAIPFWQKILINEFSSEQKHPDGGTSCHRYYSFNVQLLLGVRTGQQSAFRFLLWGGDSSYLWVSVRALDHNLGKEWATKTNSSCEEFRVKGNTPDFMLEYFIVLFLDGTQRTPTE